MAPVGCTHTLLWTYGPGQKPGTGEAGCQTIGARTELQGPGGAQYLWHMKAQTQRRVDSSRGGTECKCSVVHDCPRQSSSHPRARDVQYRGVFCSGPPRPEAELRALGTTTPAPAGLSRPGLLVHPGGPGAVTKLGIPSPPPAQRRLPIPACALPQARSTPEARRVLDAFFELYRHGCGERRSLDRGPRHVERHPRLVDGPSRPRSAPRPPASE